MKFRGIAFAQDGARVAADFPNGYGVGMRRVALHTRMVERAEECGVTLSMGNGGERDRERRRALDGRGRCLRCEDCSAMDCRCG